MKLADLHKHDVVLTTYDTLVSETQRKTRGNERAESLLDLEWCRVVLDEGTLNLKFTPANTLTPNFCSAHLIRNPKSKRHRAVRELKCRHRWCLTGTPIFNRVEDFGALLAFLRVNPFHDLRFFNSFISEPLKVNPITALENLRKIVQSVSLRRRKVTIQEDLGIPGRENRVERVIFNDDERQKYDRLKQSWDQLLQKQSSSTSRNISSQCIFQIILRLRQFCNHGLDLFPPTFLSIFSESLDEDSILNEVLETSQTCPVCMRTSRPQLNGLSQATSLDCGHLVCSLCEKKVEEYLFLEGVDCKLCLRIKETNTASGKISMDYPMPPAQNDPKVPESFYKPSSKVVALMRNLHIEKLCTSPTLKRYHLSKPSPDSSIVDVRFH